MSMSMQVSHLFVYPLKSAGPLSVPTAAVTARGLARDRRWMVFDEDGTFITGRRHPAMTQIQVTPQPDGVRLHGRDGSTHHVREPSSTHPQLSVTVWNDRVDARLADEASNVWLSAQLGVDCRLVYMPDQTRRPVDPTYAPPGDVVSFADGFPLLLTTDGSLADLNQRLHDPVEMLCFRPNIVVSGVAPFAEDGWSRIRIGSAELGVAKPCARCVFTTVDPHTGLKRADREPLQTLATYRRAEGGVMFGQNLTVRKAGQVSVGDPVIILR